MKVKKLVALGLVCASALVCCTSCAVKFDYTIDSKEVVGEQVSSAEEWDAAFRAANTLAEKEGLSYAMVVHFSEGKSLFNDAFTMNTNILGYKSTGVIEGKANGKVSYTYSIYTSKLVMRMMDLGLCYREMRGGRAIDIIQNSDGEYVGTDIGTELLANAIPVSWTLFSVSDDLGDAGYAYETSTFLPEENCYYEEKSESGYTQKTWVWIVNGVVRKCRTELMIYQQIGANFSLQEETYEVYVGGMNGTVEIPEYTFNGLV